MQFLIKLIATFNSFMLDFLTIVANFYDFRTIWAFRIQFLEKLTYLRLLVLFQFVKLGVAVRTINSSLGTILTVKVVLAGRTLDRLLILSKELIAEMAFCETEEGFCLTLFKRVSIE